jgi:hypothetical protein
MLNIASGPEEQGHLGKTCAGMVLRTLIQNKVEDRWRNNDPIPYKFAFERFPHSVKLLLVAAAARNAPTSSRSSLALSELIVSNVTMPDSTLLFPFLANIEDFVARWQRVTGRGSQKQYGKEMIAPQLRHDGQ